MTTAHKVGVGYHYPLSKRTAVYAAYSYFSNDNNSLASQAVIVRGGVCAIGESNYTVGGGLVHSF